MTTVREVFVKWGIKVDDTPLKKLDAGIETLKASAVAVGTAFAAAAATIFGLAKSAANAADEIRDTSEALGISQSEFQKLGYAASQSGSSAQELGEGLRFLSRSAIDATKAGSPAADTFKRLGVAARDGAGQLKPTTTLLRELSDRFKALPPGAEKTNLAMDLFGRSGAKFVQFLNNGSAGIAELGAELEAMGGVMSDADIALGNELNDSLDKLSTLLTGMKNAIGAALIPVVLSLVEGVREFILANREVIKSNVQGFLKNVTIAVDYLGGVFFTVANLVARAAGVFGGFGNVLKWVAAALALFALGKVGMALFDIAKGFATVARAAITMGNAALGANLKALAIPLLVGAAVAAILLIIDDFVAFLDGRPSVIGFILKNKDAILAEIVSWMERVKETFLQAIAFLIQAFFEFFGVPAAEAAVTAGKIRAAFEFAIDGIVLALKTIWVGWKEIISLVTQGVVAFVNSDFLAGLIDYFFNAFANIAKFISDIFNVGLPTAIANFVTNTFATIKGLFGTITGLAETVGKAIGFDLGGVSLPALSQGAAAGLISPAAVPGASSVSTNVAPVTTVNVTVPPGSDAEGVGEAVRRAVGEEFGKVLRPALRANKAQMAY